MDCFRSLLSLCSKRQKPDALSSSALHIMSLDILFCIVDYLPPESAVAFSLSCSTLRHILGPQESKLASSTGHTLALLNLLAIDLPDCVVCVPCRRLHKMENLQRYNSATYSAGSRIRQYDSLRLPTCVANERHGNIRGVTDSFGATAFKMVMKRHHQQPSCTILLSMISNTTARTIEDGDYVRQSREECRVIYGHLMHRLQNVRISRKPLNGTAFEEDHYFEKICPHLMLIGRMVQYRSGIRRCQECRTEYSIDLDYYDGHGRAMFSTRWKDLGSDPENEIFKEHIPQTPEDAISSIMDSFLGLSSAGARAAREMSNPFKDFAPAGVISSAFGDGNDFKFDSWLTPEHKSELFRVQERCVARRR